MVNAPRLEIEYLVDYELTFTNTDDFHSLSNIGEVNGSVFKLDGKKGFHLSGGSVDSNGEVSGVLLDGTYTFYKSETKAYNGIMGDELSGEDYSFQSQYIDFKTTNDNTYIKSIIVHFDSVAGEYATEMSFSNGVNGDGSQNNLYNGSTIIRNNSLIFMYSFGENSNLKSVRLNVLKWSKKNALMKVLKIKTGYTGIYTPATINNLSFSRDKFNDENELRFGVSSQNGTANIIDVDGIIKSLYLNDLFFKNIQTHLYIDDVLESSYILENKKGTNGDNFWEFEFKDILSFKLDEKVKPINIFVDENNNIQPLPLTYFISFAVNKQINIVYEDGLEEELNQILIPIPFVSFGQTRYDLLLKCCQVGLLRMYTDRFGNLFVSRGL